MSEAIFSTERIVEVSLKALEYLKERATLASSRRFRLCLHRSREEQIQESVIVFCQDTYNRPHRHPVGKTESYHIIQGEMTVFFFDDLGRVIRKIEMGECASGKTFLYRIGTNTWHTPVPKSDFVVFHETLTGPFEKELVVEYAGWSPEQTDLEGISDFFKKIK